MRNHPSRAPMPAQGTLPQPLMTRIGYLLNRTALQVRHMACETLKPMGLLPPHVAVLSTLHAEGPQTQRALGLLLRIDPTTMVWLVDYLEKFGLIQRGLHPSDRRAHLVQLTAKGKARFLAAARSLDRLEKKFLAPLTAREQEELKALLRKLFQSVSDQTLPTRLFDKS